MGKSGLALAALCMLGTPALSQTAFRDIPAEAPYSSLRSQDFFADPTPFAERNADRRFSEKLPGAWQSEKQILGAVQSAEKVGESGRDGVMLYATSKRTVLSWKLGGGLDDASLARTELTPGQASIGVAYRAGAAMIGLAYVNREYSQRIGAENVSQSEDFAGLTVKLQLGGK